MVSRTTHLFRAHAPLFAILLIFLVLATIYNLSLPLFEAPDEADHFRYIKWLADGRGLPNLDGDLSKVGHEAAQPPLYYAILAPVVAAIDTGDPEDIAPRNPYWRKSEGINVHYHTAAEQFPYQTTALAVHLVRFVSTLLATVTIAGTYGLARLIIPKGSLLAAALVAFNPQFIFISAAVSNDTLVAAASTLTLLLLVWIVTREQKVYWWSYLLLGALWGLALLSKTSGLALGAVIGLGLLFRAQEQRSWSELLRSGFLVSLGLIGVAGWWFLNNWIRYDNPLAWSQFLRVAQGLIRDEPLTWVKTLSEATFLRKSYWAMFAYGIPAPDIFYWLVNALVLIALIGLIFWLLKGRYRQISRPLLVSIGLLAIWSLLVFAPLMSWIRLVHASNQGRLLFPAISSLAVLMALGLSQYSSRWFRLGLITLLAAWAAAVPLIIIQPAFAQPQSLAPNETIPNLMRVDFGEQISLLGFELDQSSVAPGESLAITLYWQGNQPIMESYIVSIQAKDPEGRVVTTLDAIPYQNRYPTAVWPIEQPFADTYHLPAMGESASPGLGTIEVKLYPVGQRQRPLPVSVGEVTIGSQLELVKFKLASHEPPVYFPTHVMETTFDQKFRLLGYDLTEETDPDQPFALTLYWEALTPDGRDYTVFVHMIDEKGNIVNQADSPPQDNRYPTSIWAAGEQIQDIHQFTGLASPAEGPHQLAIGLYDPATGERLVAYRLDGTRWPDNSVIVAPWDLE